MAAWRTHYYQMAGLAWACRAAGHEVRVAGQPAIVEAVIGTGMTAVSVGGHYNIMAGFADTKKAGADLARKWNLKEGEPLPAGARQEFLALAMVKHIKAAEDMIGDLVAFARWWRPDIVISDPLVYAAPPAAAAAGAPLVRYLLGPDIARRSCLPGNGISGADDPRARWPAELVELYAQYGLTVQDDVAVCTLDTCPDSLQIPGVSHRVPVRYVPYSGPGAVPPWLLEPAGRPRVCVTWGFGTTTVLGQEAFLVPRILAGLRELSADVIIAVQPADRERLGEVPSGMRVVEAMPLDIILPTCDAIVHHSGSGTALTAAYYGLPQVTVPQFGDQALVSEQLSRIGAAIQADISAVTAAASAALFSDGPRQAARRLQQEIFAQPTPAETVHVLEQLTGT